MIKFTMANQNK